jgi:hypothetical protein
MQFSCAESREIFGRDFTIVLYRGKQYLIGVQIAHFLKRETFNLYRSMKLNSIDVVKCDSDQVEELAQLDAVKRGIHSVTLIPIDDAVAYINREMKRKPRKKTDKKSRHHRTSDVGDLSVTRASPSSPIGVGTRAALAAAVAAAAQNGTKLYTGQHLEIAGLNSSEDDDSISSNEGYSAAEESANTSGSDDHSALWSRLLLVAAKEHIRESSLTSTLAIQHELCV